MPRREPPRVREALSPHRRSYLYGRQSFRDSADSLYRALLTKNRKLLGWLPRPFTRATAHVHDVHPCFHVPQSSRFIYHRFDVSTPFGYRSRKTHPEFLPHSVPMRPSGSDLPSEMFALSRDDSGQERKKRVNPNCSCRLSFAIRN